MHTALTGISRECNVVCNTSSKKTSIVQWFNSTEHQVLCSIVMQPLALFKPGNVKREVN